MKTILWALLVVLPSMLFAQPQQSENFRITKSVLDAGGGVSTSSSFRLTSALGQPSPVGVQTSANFTLSGGFLNASYSLSPLSPLQQVVILPAQPNVGLYWERLSGASSYKVYRSTDPHFTPAPGNLIGTTSDTTFNDAGVVNLPVARYYYIVTALNGAGLALETVKAPAPVSKAVATEQVVKQSPTQPLKR